MSSSANNLSQVKEIRVQEDKLKSISDKIAEDTKVRDQLRLQADEQAEIEMLDKQANSEYRLLQDLIKENSFAITSQGENVRVTEEDPVSPCDVLHNNVRKKLLDAQDDVERSSGRVGSVQKKVAEKQALLGSHQQRLQQLTRKKTSLLSAEGGAQKIKSVIRALLRFDKDSIDPEKFNEETSPTELLAYIAERIEELSKADEKPESVKAVLKRLKKMVSFLRNVFLHPCLFSAFILTSC